MPELDAIPADQNVSGRVDAGTDTGDRERSSAGTLQSRPDAPRVIITNSMMVGMFDNLADWEVAAQMGVANYGQMTAAVGCISGRKVSSMGHSIRY